MENITLGNYKEKFIQLQNLVNGFANFLACMEAKTTNSLPAGMPPTVNGIVVVMQILNCGRSKAYEIMTNPKYQSAFYGKRGERNRLCDTQKLLNLMKES